MSDKTNPSDELRVQRELQLLEADDGTYVLSSLSASYALPKLVEYIVANREKSELRGRIKILNFLITDIVTYKKLKTDLDVTLLDFYDKAKAELNRLEGWKEVTYEKEI